MLFQYSIGKSLSFHHFCPPLVGGQGLIESIFHSVYCCPALNYDTMLTGQKEQDSADSSHSIHVIKFL